MSFLPVGTTRVPFLLNQKLGTDNLLRRQQELSRTAQELSTGIRISLPSVDPAGATQVSALQMLQERKTQYLANLQASDAAYSVTEQAMRTVENSIDAAKAIGLRNNTNTITQAEREGDIQALDGLIANLLNAGNTSYLGRPVFGGQALQSDPFVRDGSYIRFQGDNGMIDTFGNLNTLFPLNITANTSIGTESNAGRGSDLNPAITASTRLASLNNGAGIVKGSILVDDGSGGPAVTINLSQADTIQNVLDKLNDPSLGLAITATINPAGNGIQLASGAGPITVREVAGNSTAASLGIRAEAQASPLVGRDLNPTLSLTTPISSLRGGAGLDLSGGLQIDNGSYSATIDFSTPPTNTVEDLLNRINGSGTGVRAEINEARNGINVVSVLSGAQFSIRETSATSTTGSQLGILTTNLDTPLSEFQNGAGVQTGVGNDIRITTRNGNTFDIDLDSVKTIRDLQSAITDATGGDVFLDVHPQGGLRLVEAGTVVPNGVDGFSVQSLNGSAAAKNLGIEVDAGTGSGEIHGDPNAHTTRVSGIFDSLLRLRDGLMKGDLSEIEIATRQLDADRDRVLTAAGQLGSKMQTIDITRTRIEDEMVVFKRETSQIYEADFSETVTKLALQQTSLQAALASTSRLLQGSLLDYL